MHIWATVVHTVDPASSRLPSLRNPTAVGNSLVVLTVCMFIGVVLMSLPGLSQAVRAAQGDVATARPAWSTMSGFDWRFALLLMIAGIWGVKTLAPPRGNEPHGPVWDDIWRLAVGYMGWIACATMLARMPASQASPPRQATIVLILACGAFAIIGLIGLRGVLRVIGQRSREYRRMRGGRQSVELIIPAVVVAVVGSTLMWMAPQEWTPSAWRYGMLVVGRMLAGASMLMIVIGLGYLVGNAWAIRAALRRPPPALDEILLPHMPNPTWVPDRED